MKAFLHMQKGKSIKSLKRENKKLRGELHLTQYRYSQLLLKIKRLNLDIKYPNLLQQVDPATPNNIPEEIIINSFRSPNRRRFSNFFKQFSYSIYIQSPASYRTIRDVLPFPSERLLRKEFSPKVQSVEDKLTNISKGNIISLINPLLNTPEEIRCVLAIDAFSVSYLQNKKAACDGDNYCFIYLLQPLSSNYKNIPIHLYPSPNGKATQEIIDKAKVMIEIITCNTKLSIPYIAVDGDSTYNPEFSACFSQLSTKIHDHYLNDSILQIKSNNVIWISDTLHILKNLRSKLLTDTLVYDPFNDPIPFRSNDFEKILNLGEALTNKTSLAKLRDSFPLTLFQIHNALKIREFYSNPGFCFMLPFSLWVYAILGDKININERLIASRLALTFILKLADLYFTNRYPTKTNSNEVRFWNPQIWKKRTKNHPYIVFGDEQKFIRITLTIASLIHELSQAKPGFGIQRLGTHCLENEIGKIRVLCKGNDEFNTIRHNLARLLYVETAFEKQFIKIQKKRIHKNYLIFWEF